MHGTRPMREEMGSSFWPWLVFWARFLILAVLVIFGAFVARIDARPGNYGCALTLIIASLLLGLLFVRQAFDGAEPGCSDTLLVGDMDNLAIAIPLFTIIGLIGLFLAWSERAGTVYVAGLVLFLVSAVIVFFDIKRVFDRIDAGGRRE